MVNWAPRRIAFGSKFDIEGLSGLLQEVTETDLPKSFDYMEYFKMNIRGRTSAEILRSFKACF